MLFNSYAFIFAFLPATFFVYFYLNSKRLTTAAKAWLVLTSLFFYSWWNVAYLPLILMSILVNYTIANKMIKYNKSEINLVSKKRFFQIGLFFNVGLLAYFKYMDFFISNTNILFNTNIELLNLALPLAISFFTLQQIAFLIDSYEGLIEENKFLTYSLFVTFFPQLIAGPIVHHREMIPQFFSAKNKVKNYRNIAIGLFVFSLGLFKKVVVADTFAGWANTGFDTATTLNLFEAWATSLSYTFQLYFDFSGYMDMVMGAALLFNIKLPQNFNSPYKATGMIDYWNRWHITLSVFITTYIYTPILRSFKRASFGKAMTTTIAAFLISGIWHGAHWMFVFWGLLNGLGVVINHYWRKTIKFKIHKVLAWFITFNFVNITFVIFRAKEWDGAIKVLSAMFSLDYVVLPARLYKYFPTLTDYGVAFANLTKNIGGDSLNVIFTLLIAFIIVLGFKNVTHMIDDFKITYKSIVLAGFGFFFGILALNRPSDFLYFNF